MNENVGGTKMTRKVEKTGFCDVGYRAGISGVFLNFNFFGKSAAECEYAASSDIRLISFPGSARGVKWNEMEASDWLRAFFSNVFGHMTRWPSFFANRKRK